MRVTKKRVNVIFTLVVTAIVVALGGITIMAGEVKRTSDYDLDTEHEISVLSHNLRLTAFDEMFTDNSIVRRLGRMEDLCRTYDADIKCFQEADLVWRNKLKSIFPANEYYVTYQKNTKGLSNPIFVKKSKFDLIDSGYLLLNEAYVADNGKKQESRTASWVKVRDKDTGKTLTMINTHLAFNTKIQIDSCNMMKEFGKNAGTDGYLISGDFNFSMSAKKKYNILATNGSKDMAYAAIKEGKTGVMSTTCHGFGNSDENSRIDFFFGSNNLIAKMYTVVNDLFRDGFASDHYGILTYIDID